LKRSLKTKLPRYNNDDDVEQCQYWRQENELVHLTRRWLLRQFAADSRGRTQQHLWHSATVDLTAHPSTRHAHTPSARAHTFRLELTADTVNDVTPARRETTADSAAA